MTAVADPELPLALDGLRLEAEVKALEDDHAVVELEGGHPAHVPLGDFRVARSDAPQVAVGDRLEVHVEHLSHDGSHWVASRDKVLRLAAFERVRAAYRAEATVEGEIVGPVEGGYAVDVGVRAFLPASQVGLRPVRRSDDIIGQRLIFKIIRFDKARQNVVLSRRVLLEAEQTDRLAHLKVGAIVEGTVRSFTEYGAFIDVGSGLEGLLHIQEMSWTRIRRPQEAVKKGEKVKVKVIALDPDKKRISFSLRQLQDDPWLNLPETHPVGSEVSGLVVSKTDFGCFIQIERGLEGLVHSTGSLVTPGDAAAMRKIDVGDEIRARVVDIDMTARRLSLVLVRDPRSSALAAFGHAGVRFEPDDGYAVVAFTATARVEDLELASRLVAVAGDGPTPAWLVARLAHLTKLDPHLFGPAIEVEPDGLFVADLLAVDEAGRVLAKLQLQASPTRWPCSGWPVLRPAPSAPATPWWRLCSPPLTSSPRSRSTSRGPAAGSWSAAGPAS